MMSALATPALDCPSAICAGLGLAASSAKLARGTAVAKNNDAAAKTIKREGIRLLQELLLRLVLAEAEQPWPEAKHKGADAALLPPQLSFSLADSSS
jgi:hypothetical protein